MSERKYIERFDPCVEVYDEVRHKDFLENFNCNSFIFNKYITSHDIIEDKYNGDGVTYLVFDENAVERKLVAYYTLCATAIPFLSRIKLEFEERVDEAEYDERLYGVSAMQIKMFAVDIQYQNIFYKQDELEMPISAWILRYIVNAIDSISCELCGVKAIFLHAVEDAKLFYYQNSFIYADERIRPFDSEDSELTSMFLKLREVRIVYDD